MDHLRAEGIQRLVLESTSDYWRIWYYLAEAAGLEVWLVNARDVKHLPGRGKSDRPDCVWHCKLNERGMLRRSFVPPRGGPGPAGADPDPVPAGPGPGPAPGPGGEDPRRRAAEDLGGDLGPVRASGRRFLDALVAGERSPAALAALGDYRLKASPAELEEALTGRFRDIHATEIAVHLRLIDAINAEITALDEQIGQQLPPVPGTAPACTACGLAGGGHAPGLRRPGLLLLGLADRLDEITGIGAVNGRAIIAELGTDPSQFPTPGHAAGWARLTPRMQAVRGDRQARPHRQGQPVPARRARPGRDDRGQDRHPARRDVPADRPQARQAESHRRGRPRHLRDRLDPDLRPLRPVQELGPDYYSPRSPARQTQAKIREIERLNPGKKVILADDRRGLQRRPDAQPP